MTLSLKRRLGIRALRWSGGGVLAAISIGMHGLLLGMPMPGSHPEDQESSELSDPAAMIDVVRLPATSNAAPEAVPPAAVSVAQAPQSPSVTRAAPAAPQRLTQPTPQPQPEPPLAPNPISDSVPEGTSEPGLEPVPVEQPPATLADRLRDPAQYAFNQQAKSLSTDDVNFHLAVVPQWLDRESQGLSDTDIPVLGRKLAPLRVPYPINTCLDPAPAEGLVGVIVSATGELVKEPVLLDSTGYTVLDEKALELALQQTFNTQGGDLPNPHANWLPVQVQYDGTNCTP